MSRRARPTLRVLREDLASGWGSPYALRALEAGEISAVQPLGALDHPILQKASESFGEDPSQDSFVGPISSVNSEALLEIKQGQWRAGLWVDGDACWVVAAGLAKGGHRDRDDFYQQLERLEESNAVTGLLPTSLDRNLLKKERAHAVIAAWQLQNQERVIATLGSVLEGGTGSFTIESPVSGASADETFGTVTLTVLISTDPDDSYEDVVVEVAITDRWKASKLVWPLTTQLLAAINPPEQGWDVAGGIYSNLMELGSLSKQLAALRELASRQEIATTVAGKTAHYTHRRDLTERSVEGRAARALCGVYFVPRRDAESLATCSACSALIADIPEE